MIWGISFHSPQQKKSSRGKRRKKGRSSPPCPLGSTHTHSPNTHASNLPTPPVWRSPAAPLAAKSWAEIRSSWLLREAKNPLISPLLRSVSDGPTGREKRGRSEMEWRGFTAKKKKEPSQVEAKLFKLSYFRVVVRKRSQIDVLWFKRIWALCFFFAENIFLNLKSSERNLRRGG